ncbi:hypothetical protein WJX72_009290 [[Myrmecia] bisecta]|uniref:Uncharacterized protein n=1 Tax=[Myrmecia] bisecta TaxID=41462 RepID=A0AAW1QFX4_9CHLO
MAVGSPDASGASMGYEWRGYMRKWWFWLTVAVGACTALAAVCIGIVLNTRSRNRMLAQLRAQHLVAPLWRQPDSFPFSVSFPIAYQAAGVAIRDLHGQRSQRLTAGLFHPHDEALS